jgi:hypothetical protein
MLSLMAKKEGAPNSILIEDAIVDFLTGKSMKTSIEFGKTKIMTYEEISKICEQSNHGVHRNPDIKK